jgi:hypothetical protein
VALPVVLAIGLGTLALLIVLLIALVRHLKVLSSSLRRFQQEVQPALEDLREGSASAQGHIERLASGNDRPGGRLRP